MSSFSDLTDIENQLNGEENEEGYPTKEGSSGSPHIKALSGIVSDRLNSRNTAQQTEAGNIRLQAMTGIVERLTIKVIAEQEVLGYAIALNKGTPLPDSLSEPEKECVRQTAMLLNMSSQGVALAQFRVTPRSAIEGLRKAPALNPYSS